jgi:hypothetical protein
MFSIEWRPEARPVVLKGDALDVERAGALVHVRSDLMTLDANFGRRPIDARLIVHANGEAEPLLEHCFSIFLHKFLQLSGVVRLHGAAVEVGEKTHVFLGEKGAGKSTISLALGQAGGHVLADDQIVIRRRADCVAVSGCDSNIRLTEPSERHLLDAPLNAEPRDFAGTLKKEVALDGLVTAIPYEDRPAARICFPRVGERFENRPITGRAAVTRILDAIAPAHGFAGPADRWDLVAIVSAFVAAADCYDVELSPNLADLRQLVLFAQS